MMRSRCCPLLDSDLEETLMSKATILMFAAAIATTGCAQTPKEAMRLDRFAGSWEGWAVQDVGGQLGPVSMDSKPMKVTAKKSSPDTLVVEGSLWGFSATLKYDSKTHNYLLTAKADFLPPIDQLPLSYSD